MMLNNMPISSEQLIDVLIIDSLKNVINKYGLEGTEDMIKDLYKLMPEARDRILFVYNKIYKRK